MASRETLCICLLAVGSLFATIWTLPLSPSDESSKSSSIQPQLTQDLTESDLEAPTPIFSLATFNELSWNMPTNQMEQPATDSLSLQMHASQSKHQGSWQTVESPAVGPHELHGGPEETLTSVKARLGSEEEAWSGLREGDDSQVALIFKRTEGDTHEGPAARREQNQRTVRGAEDGPNQGVLLNGRAWESPFGYRQSDSLGSHATAPNLSTLPQGKRADSVDFYEIPRAPSGAKVQEPARMTKGVSNAKLSILSPSQVPVRQELSSESGILAGPQVTELDTLLSVREEPRVEGNDRGSEPAKKPIKKELGIPDGGFQITKTITSTAVPNASTPSMSRAPSSEQTEPRQTVAMDSIQQSTPFVLNIQESVATSSASTHNAYPDLIMSLSIGESKAAASPALSEFPKGQATPMPSKTPRDGHPGTKQGVTTNPWASGALVQSAVKSNTPSSTVPDTGVIPPILVTARIETRTLGKNQSLQALPVWRDDAATPTLEDIPLIFEPLDGTLSEVMVTVAPGGTQQVSHFSSITAQKIQAGLELITTVSADGGPSPSGVAPPAVPSGPLLSWQTSGTKMSETHGPSTLPSAPLDYAILYTEGEHDDKEMKDSKDARTEEDVTEVTTVVYVRPIFSHIPYHFHPGSIWVQRNQGLVHSWVEKIRDKAGYVSEMLAPLGIGIAGALFILGALYSIKVMHHRRRTGYKHQRRKHRETGSRQDQVMLLADSSEDEF